MFQRQGIGFSNPFQFANPFQQFSGGVNPYLTLGSFGGINPLASQVGGFGVNPYVWQPPVFTGLPNPIQGSQFGIGISPVVNPMLAAQLPTVNPFLQTGIGTVNPMLAAQLPTVNPFLQTGIGTVNPLLAAQLPTVNPFLQTGIGTVNPLLAAQLGTVNPFLQTGIGGVHPTAYGQAFPQHGIGPDPGILSLQGQQLNPLAQQLPIRPLVGANPFEQAVGLQGITGPIVDPYAALAQAQLLSQIANPLHQMYRSFPGNIWATQGIQPITGQASPFAQTGVPFCA